MIMTFARPILSTVVYTRTSNGELNIKWKDSLVADTPYQEQTTPCPANNFFLFWNPDNNNFYPFPTEGIPSNYVLYLTEIGA